LKALVRRDIDHARREEYPSIGDQLDAFWKILAVSGIVCPEDAERIRKKVDDVKRKYPKREATFLCACECPGERDTIVRDPGTRNRGK